MQGGRGYNRTMRNKFLPFLLNLPLFFTPLVALGADRRTEGGIGSQQAANGGEPAQKADDDQAQSGSKAEADSTDAETPKRRKRGRGRPPMEITSDTSGLKTLTIHFRWKLYPDASIEMRLVSEPIPQGAKVTPIYFCGATQGPGSRCLIYLPGSYGRGRLHPQFHERQDRL